MAKELDEKTQALVDKHVSKAKKEQHKAVVTAVKEAVAAAKDEVEDKAAKKAVADVGKGIVAALNELKD